MAAAIEASLLVRAMEEDDLDRVMVIEEASYEFCWTRRIFADCLRVGYTCLVLAQDEEVYGYGVLMLGPQEAHVLNVCIAESLRGQGWARHLMHELTDVSIRSGCRELFLEVRPSNPIALNLYTSLGFHEIGMRPGYYKTQSGREDAIVMAMSLEGIAPHR
ncbi:MAG TPA: ribosomal-protein-alanine N-acetyltransferase [Gammaproteobacteria bacterium]|jgi:ribosomal-protein-alanine N-acetyltransferase|nr:ribosomal-protein-alanine N-acetyltransferase [Gammaproteobacteria bacterium]